MGSVESIARTHALAPQDEILARYEAAGFSGSAGWPVSEFDPTIDDQRVRVVDLLAGMAQLVASDEG